MNFVQNLLQIMEVGKGQIVARIVPLAAGVLIIGLGYDFVRVHGLNDSQSMDNAQVARQIVRGHGFTTEFLRPYAVTQLHDYAVSQNAKQGGSVNLFPSSAFPPGTPRILPDTYNAPGYPYLLAGWFYLVHPEFEQTNADMASSHGYSGDRWIPPLNQIFLLLTAFLVFILGYRLFDPRVAWFSFVAFFATDLVWHYSVTALSTTFLMFLVTAVLFCAVEIVRVGEACFESEAHSFAPAWLWAVALGLLLAVACLTRLNVLVLLVPLFILLLTMQRASWGPPLVIALVVIGLVTPWFVHLNNVCGNPLGSNLTLVLLTQVGYQGNQIFCTTSIPSYEHFFRSALIKEYLGFLWQFEHAWNLLGANPLIIFFGASLLHVFKRRRTRAFHWLLVGSLFLLVAANNLGMPTPESIDPWNIMIVLLPGMLVIGSAFYFILLDRMNIQIRLLTTLIVTSTLLLTAMPLAITLSAGNPALTNYPPYSPLLIKVLSQYSQPDEWVTTDMPWATAWYGDRPSLWLPDSISDFENLHDNVCPTGMLIFTPISWSKPFDTFKTGEFKDWLSFATELPTPADFPLPEHLPSSQTYSYSVWSDRPRWQAQVK